MDSCTVSLEIQSDIFRSCTFPFFDEIFRMFLDPIYKVISWICIFRTRIFQSNIQSKLQYSMTTQCAMYYVHKYTHNKYRAKYLMTSVVGP